MENKRTVFLTGATGFLGSHLLVTLLKNGHKVFALARGKKQESPKNRIEKLIKFWDSRIKYDPKNLVIVDGDIVHKNCGIGSKKVLDKIILESEIIYHSAAIAELKWPIDAIRKVNVDGTKNVLDLAMIGKKHGSLKKVNHISTAYVVGDKNGIEFTEDMLELGQGFHNTYEQSKYEAELLVHKYIRKGLNVSIFRPSMVMGGLKDGKTASFRLFYEPLHFFMAGIFDNFPADSNCFQNLINVDTVSNVLYLLGDREGMTVYHVISPNNTKVGSLFEMASEYFGFKLPNFVHLDKFDFSKWTPAQKFLAGPFVPYFNYNTKFGGKKTGRVLSEYNCEFPIICNNTIRKIFRYTHESGFVRKLLK